MGIRSIINKHFHLSFHHQHADKVSRENGEHKVIAGSLGSVKNSSAQPPTPGGNGRVSTQSRPLPPTPGGNGRVSTQSRPLPPTPGTISAEKGINATTGSQVKNESFVDAMKNMDGFSKAGELIAFVKNTNAILPAAGQVCLAFPEDKSELYKAQENFQVYRGELTPFVMYNPRFVSSLNENIAENKKLCSDVIEHKGDINDAVKEIDVKLGDEHLNRSERQALEARKSEIQSVGYIGTKIDGMIETEHMYGNAFAKTIENINETLGAYYKDVGAHLNDKDKLSPNMLSEKLKGSSAKLMAELQTQKPALQEQRKEIQNSLVESKKELRDLQEQLSLAEQMEPEAVAKLKEAISALRKTVHSLDLKEISINNAEIYVDQALAEAAKYENNSIQDIENNFLCYQQTGMSCAAKNELERNITERVIPTLKQFYQQLVDNNKISLDLINTLKYCESIVMPLLNNMNTPDGQNVELECKGQLMSEVANVQKGITEKLGGAVKLVTELLKNPHDLRGNKKLKMELNNADNLLRSISACGQVPLEKSYIYGETDQSSPIYGYRKALGLVKDESQSHGHKFTSRLHLHRHRNNA
ncbi:hypothetical protein [Citrobacter sp. U14242]|uniref:hypothetical protein n=1 Tax=Citrobacter sp. U14242 TaxID=3390192 RepID=UPI00397A983E